MSTNVADDVVVPDPVRVGRPLKERLIAVFGFSKWFPNKRSCRTKTDSFGAQKKARSSAAKEDVHPNFQQRQQQKPQERKEQKQAPQITSISNAPTLNRPKIANYEPPKRYTSRRIGSVSAASSRNFSGPMSSAPSRNYSAAYRQPSGAHSVPASGELSKGGNGGPKFVRSSSKSLTKLRDQYVKAMLKLGDMADSVSMGTSVHFESQMFESEVIRKRSQAESEIMDYYLQSGIQPDEWKNAQIGSRINRSGTLTV